MPGFPARHQLPELAQTYVHQVDNAIQLPHTLSSPSPPAFNLFQHHGLFQGVSSSHQMAKVIGVSASASVLPMNIQDWFHLGWTGWISLQSKGLSRAFCNTTVQNQQFFDFHMLSININSISISKTSILCLSHIKCKIFYEVQFVIILFSFIYWPMGIMSKDSLPNSWHYKSKTSVSKLNLLYNSIYMTFLR